MNASPAKAQHSGCVPGSDVIRLDGDDLQAGPATAEARGGDAADFRDWRTYTATRLVDLKLAQDIYLTTTARERRQSWHAVVLPGHASRGSRSSPRKNGSKADREFSSSTC